jgi:ketosteroid isomerase-like protein
MDIRELAEDFAELCADGRAEEAAEKYWADNIATYEAMPGEYAETHGRAETMAKAKWWFENHEVHEMEVEGPWINGDQFMLYWEIEVTPKGGERMEMEELVLYTVKDGKVVEERYFY